MPQRKPSGDRTPEDRTPAQREADHANLAHLSDTLVTALVEKLAASGLGELEVREGSWHIRLRRPPSAAPQPGRRSDRTRTLLHAERDGRSGWDGTAQSTPSISPSPESRAEDRDVDDDPPRSVATSPAVGIFRSEVAVGTSVRVGDSVGVVDMLGIPQHVPSPIDGTLVEVFPASGEAVEYGEAIGAVAPDVPRPGPDAAEPDAVGSDDPDGDATDPDHAGTPAATPDAGVSEAGAPVASEASGAAVTGAERR